MVTLKTIILFNCFYYLYWQKDVLVMYSNDEVRYLSLLFEVARLNSHLLRQGFGIVFYLYLCCCISFTAFNDSTTFRIGVCIVLYVYSSRVNMTSWGSLLLSEFGQRLRFQFINIYRKTLVVGSIFHQVIFFKFVIFPSRSPQNQFVEKFTLAFVECPERSLFVSHCNSEATQKFW